MEAALVKQGVLTIYELPMTPSMPPTVTRCASSPGLSRTLQVSVVSWHVGVLRSLLRPATYSPTPFPWPCAGQDDCFEPLLVGTTRDKSGPAQ